MEKTLSFSDVEKLITTGQQATRTHKSGVIDVAKVKEYTQILARLQQASSDISKLKSQVDSAIHGLVQIQEADQELLSQLAGGWTVARKKTTAGAVTGTLANTSIGASDAAASEQPPRARTTAAAETLIMISAAHGINARIVSDISHVKADSHIYFVRSYKHFAFILGGMLFHGNIGNIFSRGSNLEYIEACKYGPNCDKQKECKYYHDPAKCPGSTNVRNYTTQSWIYDPNDSRRISRTFGSLENIDIDILQTDQPTGQKFIDQTVHDMLCSLILLRSAQQQS